MLHGFTGDENSMWVFARGLPAEDWVIAPRAPHTAEPFGYSWRPVDGDVAPQRSRLDLFEPAVRSVLGLVDEYAAASGLKAEHFDVVGFSQGAVLASVFAMLHPERVRRLGLLAGFVPRGVDELIARRPLEGRQIFMANGTQDEIVSIEQARRSVGLLEQAGAQVTFCEADVGHKVSVDCMRALQAYLGV